MATASSVPPATQSAADSPASDVHEREQWPYGYGNFQRFILCVAITGLAVLMCHSQVFSVISGPVDHWCKPPARFANLSVQAWKNIGIPMDRNGQYSQCLVYARPGVVPFNDSEKRAVAECDEWDYDAERAHQTVRRHWNLVCYRGRLAGLGNGVFMSGALLVVPAMGYVADAMGRQPVIAAAVLSLCVSCLGCCFADTYSLFLAARFVASGCVSTIFVVVFIMMYEVTPPERTVLFVSIASGAGNFLSEAFLLALVRQSLGWFALQIIALSPTFVLLPALLLIPESPQWLLTNCRFREAGRVMVAAARMNGLPAEETERSTRRLLRSLRGPKGGRSPSRIPLSPAAQFRCVYTRKRALVACVLYFTSTLVFYAFTWAPAMRDSSARTLSTALSVPGHVVMYLALNVVARKQLLLLTLPLQGILCCVYSALVYEHMPAVVAVVVITSRECAFVTLAATFLYITDSFHTGIRSVVVGAGYASGRVGAVCASALELLREQRSEDLGLALVALAVFVSVILLLWLPDEPVERFPVSPSPRASGTDFQRP
ncbi:solute carrier family 22 member 13-like [Haemaphysalis longicornis]